MAVALSLDSLRTPAKGLVVMTSVGIVVYFTPCAYRRTRDLLRRTIGTRLMSWLISRCRISNRLGTLRKDFRRMDIQRRSREMPGHSHPTSALDRTNANDALDSLITSFGYVPYSVSMSSRDTAVSNCGSRLYHFAKDMAMDYRNDPITSRHILKFMDVDFYCDMHHYAKFALPILMYTFVPRSVAGPLPDATFTIASDVVYVTVNGGATYSHMLWDYNHDCLIFDYWWGSIIYMVEGVKTNDPTRRIIGLFPVAKIYGPLGWLLPGHRLARRTFSYGPVNISRYHEGNVLRLSVGRAHWRDQIDIPEAVFAACFIRCNVSKAPNIGDVERVLTTAKIANCHLVSPLLHDVLAHCRDFFKVTVVADTSKAADKVNYQTIDPMTYDDGQPTARVVGPQFCTGNVAPCRSYNNDVTCIENRVERIKNPSKPWPTFFHRCANEFLDKLIPIELRHTGAPWTFEEVEERQNRPTQRAACDAAKPFAYLFKFVVKSFQKAETYPDIKYPRNISTTNADHRLRYGTFIYSITNELFKRCDWYAFGREPLAIANRVHDLIRGANTVIPTDFSSFDGTHSTQLVEFEQQLGRMFFAPAHHAEWDELITSQYNRPAVTRHGVFYNTGSSRLSGSSDTSSFNSFDNALIAYVALRNGGLSPAQSWSSLGFYGGDDGLTVNISPRNYRHVAELMGLTLKADVVLPNSPVPFLGRIYLDPWTTPNSIIDVQRQVRRLHLSCAPDTVPSHIALRRRAEGLIVTDAQTPFISHWARKVLELTAGLNTVRYDNLLRTDDLWFAQYTNQFPQQSLRHDLCWSIAADQLGVSASELFTYCGLIDDALDFDDFPVNIFDLGPKVVTAAVIGGELFWPPGSPRIMPEDEPILPSQPAACAAAKQPAATPPPSHDPRNANNDTPAPSPQHSSQRSSSASGSSGAGSTRSNRRRARVSRNGP